MDLFNSTPNSNLLPYDGEVYYYGPLMAAELAQQFYTHLLNNIPWTHDKAVMYGKTIITKRKVAWHGDSPFKYTYSNTTKSAAPWTAELQQLKSLVEKTSAEKYNSCLLNLYHSGEEAMAWHSDDEKDLKENGAIASLSFGADRKFTFKHKERKHVVSLVLQKGSLLVMTGSTQKYWLHRLPPTKKVKNPRINLTFRTIDGQVF